MAARGAARRSRRIAAYLLLTAAAALLPLVGSSLLARHLAFSAQRDHLTELAGQAIERIDGVFDEVERALVALARETDARCDAAAIEAMRRVAFELDHVREIGAIVHDTLICTSWGPMVPPRKLGEAGMPWQMKGGETVVLPPRGTILFEDLPSIIVNHGIEDGTGVNALIDPDVLVGSLQGLADRWLLSVLLLERAALLAGAEGDPGKLARLLDERAPGELVVVASSERHPVSVIVRNDPEHLLALWRSARGFVMASGLVSGLCLSLVVVQLARRRFSLVGELAEAIERGEIVQHYQPIVEVSTGRCVGAEVLSRWQHPVDGDISPALFVPVAEQHGLIEALTEASLERVGNELGALLRARPDLHIAINLARAHFESQGLLAAVDRVCEAHGIAIRQISFEITEEAVLADLDRLIALTRDLRERGCSVAIDDFGTSYCPLAYLEQLDVDCLKIDRSFAHALIGDDRGSEIADLMFDLARRLGLEIVMEGVETEAQADALGRRKVRLAQGYLYARPMSAEAFVEFVEERSA